MSLLKGANAAYLLAPGHSVQAEEYVAMLKEFNRLAREMLFLHGHLIRPADWAQNSAADAPQGGRRVENRPAKRSRAYRLATVAAAYCVVSPARLIFGQFR
jgi:hypothetical protein